jgi:hypothetical protein
VLEVLALMRDELDQRGVDDIPWIVTTTDLQSPCADLVRFQYGRT